MTEELHLDEGAAADFLGCPASTRPDLDPMTLSYKDVELIVIQGGQDIRVPVEMNRSFSQRHTRVKYLEFPDIGHFEVIDPTNVLWMKEVGKFL
jgi:pimeloyl-ACP methyl ester carboxylesterase